MGKAIIDESTLIEMADVIRSAKGTDILYDPANFATEFSNLINSGGNGEIIDTSGTATTDDILLDKTAWVNGVKLIGTMPNHGKSSPVNIEIAPGSLRTIEQGYHSGMETLSVKSMEELTPASATAETIYVGETAWVNGELIEGTLDESTMYTKLQSLIVSKTAYINTNICPNQNYSIEMKVRFHAIDGNGNNLFGTKNNTSGLLCAKFGNNGWLSVFKSPSNDAEYATFDTSSINYKNNSLSTTDNILYRCNKPHFANFRTVKLEKNKLYIDNILIHTYTDSDSIFGHYPYPLYLFNINSQDGATDSNNGGIYEVEYVKMWNHNDNLILDLIPVMKKDGTVCMYNQTNGALFYSDGEPFISTYAYNEEKVYLVHPDGTDWDSTFLNSDGTPQSGYTNINLWSDDFFKYKGDTYTSGENTYEYECKIAAGHNAQFVMMFDDPINCVGYDRLRVKFYTWAAGNISVAYEESVIYLCKDKTLSGRFPANRYFAVDVAQGVNTPYQKYYADASDYIIMGDSDHPGWQWIDIDIRDIDEFYLSFYTTIFFYIAEVQLIKLTLV